MIVRLIVLTVLLSGSAWGQDDTDYNATAKKIKKHLSKQLRKLEFEDNDFCDLMLEMKLKQSYATVRRVHGTGGSKMCRESKKILKKQKKFRFTEPEKYIRIHVSTKDL
ncbi:hypothetical protein [Vibrio genomosp. F10]|uniref:Uncharacterized protein n=1 Tax=Vibrio genomosp. F10 str. ZF-129 TaxID=1187848 RepID=A0A1E5BFK8_9VIBR|nr:hypothetical protein [Vibrio genomosp. F10]OEE34606.1 hypothetical protein A1QO_07155 [Vibrio genomosp. F10 str. ZF-129]OEE94766.1 hypothetical protein A1QK_16210 [Vibrio genomosp. F10 str. 9ZD137]OEE96413.1 hypothetical protein A1QM_16885 [Vibrio genomosp. F10 str. 9ZC157]OEF05168.1 hypothetical protein A1QI_08930 [Vibrio genomosp. F10 str. 9ZB36]